MQEERKHGLFPSCLEMAAFPDNYWALEAVEWKSEGDIRMGYGPQAFLLMMSCPADRFESSDLPTPRAGQSVIESNANHQRSLEDEFLSEEYDFLSGVVEDGFRDVRVLLEDDAEAIEYFPHYGDNPYQEGCVLGTRSRLNTFHRSVWAYAQAAALQACRPLVESLGDQFGHGIDVCFLAITLQDAESGFLGFACSPSQTKRISDLGLETVAIAGISGEEGPLSVPSTPACKSILGLVRRVYQTYLRAYLGKKSEADPLLPASKAHVQEVAQAGVDFEYPGGVDKEEEALKQFSARLESIQWQE